MKRILTLCVSYLGLILLVGCSSVKEQSVESSSSTTNQYFFDYSFDLEELMETSKSTETTGSTIVYMESTTVEPFSGDAYINLEWEQTEDGMVVTGYTNLPDGGTGIISVESPDVVTYSAQSKTEIIGGKFISEPFTDHYMPLRGDYNIQITFSIANVQPSEFREIVGENYYYVTSDIKVPSGFGGYILQKTVPAYFE